MKIKPTAIDPTCDISPIQCPRTTSLRCSDGVALQPALQLSTTDLKKARHRLLPLLLQDLEEHYVEKAPSGQALLQGESSDEQHSQ